MSPLPNNLFQGGNTMKKAVVFGVLAALLAAPPVFAAKGGKTKKAQNAQKFAYGSEVKYRNSCEAYDYVYTEGWQGVVVGYNQTNKLYSVRLIEKKNCGNRLIIGPNECTGYYKLSVRGSGETIDVPRKCLNNSFVYRGQVVQPGDTMWDCQCYDVNGKYMVGFSTEIYAPDEQEAQRRAEKQFRERNPPQPCARISCR